MSMFICFCRGFELLTVKRSNATHLSCTRALLTPSGHGVRWTVQAKSMQHGSRKEFRPHDYSAQTECRSMSLLKSELGDESSTTFSCRLLGPPAALWVLGSRCWHLGHIFLRCPEQFCFHPLPQSQTENPLTDKKKTCYGLQKCYSKQEMYIKATILKACFLFF